MDNKTLYPSRSLCDLGPTFTTQSKIVEFKKEPYEYYHNKPKDLGERDEMYIIKSDFANKRAHRIPDLDSKFTMPNMPVRDD